MLFVCCAALVMFATPAGAANFNEGPEFPTEVFDSGFPDDTPLTTSDPTWFDAFGPGQFTGQVRSYNIGASAPSGNFVIGADGLNTDPVESLASYPTGIGATDTDVLAQFTVLKGAAHIAIGLSPSQDSGTVNNRFRDAPGSVLMLYTPGFGVELYAVDDAGGLSALSISNANLPLDLGGLPPQAEIDFRLTAPVASGATTVTMDYSTDGGSNFTTYGSRSMGLAWDPAYVTFVLRGDSVADDIIVSSVPVFSLVMPPGSSRIAAKACSTALRLPRRRSQSSQLKFEIFNAGSLLGTASLSPNAPLFPTAE